MNGEPPPSPPDVSVIIPCREPARELVDCLAGVAAQDFPGTLETVVATGTPTPGIEAAVAGRPQSRLAIGAGPLRPGGARNLGARESRGTILLFLDADCVPERGWVTAALAGLEAGAVLVGGPVLDLHPWHPVAPIDNLLQFADQGPRRPDGPAAYFPGCNLAIRRRDFEALGGFDGESPLGEDVAWCLAAAARWPAGLRFVRAMQVRHAGRARLTELWRHQEAFGRARGLSGQFLDERWQRLGAHGWAAPLVAGKRLTHLIGRTAGWNPGGLPRFLFLGPVVLFGLAGWAAGFQRGCREAVESGSGRP